MFNFRILILLLGLLILTGCASTATNIGDNLYRTSCGGIFNGWGSCYDAAKAQCTKGYTERDRKQINHPGEYNSACQCIIYPISRDMVFSCR